MEAGVVDEKGEILGVVNAVAKREFVALAFQLRQTNVVTDFQVVLDGLEHAANARVIIPLVEIGVGMDQGVHEMVNTRRLVPRVRRMTFWRHDLLVQTNGLSNAGKLLPPLPEIAFRRLIERVQKKPLEGCQFVGFQVGKIARVDVILELADFVVLVRVGVFSIRAHPTRTVRISNNKLKTRANREVYV